MDVVFAVLLDVFAVTFAVWVARRLRAERPNPLDNWKPSDDDARSGRRITLFIYPKRVRR